MRNRQALAVGTVVGAWIVAIGGNLLTIHNPGDTGPPLMWTDLIGHFVSPVIASLVVFGGIAAWAVRHTGSDNRPAGAALALGIIAVPSALVLVWTGTTIVIGVGAAFLGLLGLDRAREQQGRLSAQARIGAILGSLAALGNIGLWVAVSVGSYGPGLPS